MQLLFCDSFSQEPPDGSVYNSWSLIEFPVPVVLEQIQVVRRGLYIHEQLRAEGLCGKTSPEKFRIDFFACDEKNQKSSTFENLCALDYNEIGLTTAFPRLPFVTTKLLCSGCYHVVTLAVFGAEASDSDAVRLVHQRRNEAASNSKGLLPTPEIYHKPIERTVLPPFSNQSLNQLQPSISIPPSFQAYSGPHKLSPNYRFPAKDQNFQSVNFTGVPVHDRHRDNHQKVANQPREKLHEKPSLLPTPPIGNKDYNPNSLQYSYQQNNENSYQSSDVCWNGNGYANLSEDSAYTHSSENKSDLYPAKDQLEEDGWDDAEFVEISDEELDEETAATVEAMVAEDMLLPSSMMSFNPFHMEIYPLSYFNIPDVTEFELIRNKLQCHESTSTLDQELKKRLEFKDDASIKLKKLIDYTLKLCPLNLSNKENIVTNNIAQMTVVGKENDFVANLENMIPLLSHGLPYLDASMDNNCSIALCKWTVFALQLDNQITQKIGLNIRILKAGLNLALKLCETSGDVAECFSCLNLIGSLVQILSAKHMSSSVKILAIHVLDSFTDWPLQMYEFMYGDESNPTIDDSEDECNISGYTKIIRLCLHPQTARVSSALNQLVRKVHIYECMHEVQNIVQSLVVEKIPDEYSFVSDGECDEDDEEEYANEEDINMVGVSNASHNSGEIDEEEVEMNLSAIENSNLDIDYLHEKQKAHSSTNTAAMDTNTDDDVAMGNQPETADTLVVPLESVFCLSDVTVNDNDLLKIADCLKEITVAFRNPQITVGQFSLKHFPLSKQHTPVNEILENCRANRTLYRMSEALGLLSSVQALLTLPFVSGHASIFESCYQLLDHMMATKSGLLHLLANSDAVLLIIQHLLKSSTSLNVETPGTAGYLGAKLAFHVQAVQSIDHICSLLDSSSDEEDLEEDLVLDLKTLFSMTYPYVGKKFICSILAIDNFLEPILRCLWYPTKLSDPDPEIEKHEDEDKKTVYEDDKSDDEGSESKKEKKAFAIQHQSAINGYSSALLHFMLEISCDVSYIYRHIADITRTCLSDFHSISRSEQFKKFLGPLEKQLKCDNSDFVKLVEYIKEKAAMLEWSSLTIDGPGIATALRLLCYLCIKDKTNPDNVGTDAASRLRALELFSIDSLNVLLTLGEQLHKSLHFFCHGIRPMAAGLMSSTHTLVISMCQSIFTLLHLLLYHVLDAEIDRKNINEVRIAQVSVCLFSDIYILLRPTDTSLLHETAGKIIKVLSLFFSDKQHTTDEPNPIITEMIKHAESQCENFIPSLLLLSQLLPMPLPIITLEVPGEDARVAALDSCKLWSSIITPHVDDISSFLLPLSSSISRPVLEVVVMLMQQIIDLSPSLALTVVKKYIEDTSPLLVNPLIANKNDESETKGENEPEQKELLMLSSEQITAIVTFSEILTLPAAKTAAIAALFSEGEGVMDLWTYAVHSQTPDEDVAAALLLASVLVDTKLTLLPIESSQKSLASALPPTAHVKAIIDLAMQKMSNTSSPVVASRIYLVLNLLQQNSYVIPYIRKSLRSEERPLHKGMTKISEVFDSSNPIWLNAIGNFFNFLLLLTSPSIPTDTSNHKSSLALNFSQVKSLLRWDDSCDHPLRVIQDKLKDAFSQEEQNFSEDVDFVFDQITSLIQSLNATEGKEKVSGLDREEFPVPAELVEQFTNRQVFVLGQEDKNLLTRLSITAPLPSFDCITTDDERMVQCDLIATAEKFCPGYNLTDELGKLAKAVDVQHVAEETEAMEKRRQKIETYSARLGKSLTFMKRSHGLLMAQPRISRGRGRGRGNPSNRPFDLFRHRKQNTSRPPSMHVDDFVAADEEQEKRVGEDSFKSPPPLPVMQVRRPLNANFKSKDFSPRGGRGARIPRNNSYRGRSGFFYQNSNSSAITPSNKFRPRTSTTGNRIGRSQDRSFRGISRITSRLSFSPHEGFKTNKQQDQVSWGGQNRDHSSSYRGRGTRASKPSRGNFSISNNKWAISSFPRRGRSYNKPRGKHLRSSTR